MEIHLNLVSGKVKGTATVHHCSSETTKDPKDPQPVKKEAQRGDHSHNRRS